MPNGPCYTGARPRGESTLERRRIADHPAGTHARISPMNPSCIEFWFEFASNYSYLSVMRIEQEAARRGVAIEWRPFLLGPIFKSFGWTTSPFVVQSWKTEYVWKDMEQQCRKYGLTWKRPSAFPRASLLPARVALIGAEKPWMGEYCRRVMQLNFAADREIDSAASIAEVLTGLGLEAQEIIDQAQHETNKGRLRNQTELARTKGIFGAPSFFVGGEMFWGNDRLDDALACAAASNPPATRIS
jgi:2-hydroxychromene-2-carboxylate isomerase